MHASWPAFIIWLFVEKRQISFHTEKRTTLFHNVNFVTTLKSSELGESANKERCVQPLPDPDPTKTFTLCKAVQGWETHLR